MENDIFKDKGKNEENVDDSVCKVLSAKHCGFILSLKCPFNQ